MRKSLITTPLMIALFSSAAVAMDDHQAPQMSNFNYDYVDARIGASPLTYGAEISKSIHPNAHVVARFDSKFDNDWDFAAGAGFHAPVTNWADITGELLARGLKTRMSDHDDAYGIEINLGYRQWLGAQIEVGGKIGHLSADDVEETTGSIFGRFHTSELFSLGAEFRINEAYNEQLMFTARFKI
ncbi:hypothetical protein L0B53_11210 [Vibrio sp. SS-MA-C1-2]|uniref:hypothetical protein n=1 Tax=Vibrio sp. SS-MA-C1-2 TaxID=2908646 RepID=UPI001F45E2E0|nr:hypothetical protein [Vibrio sp. SS-MA-C1-2]UJF20004.1 hypothetical protein L0B53_11210 [Vibrio sp. SS-MA-C1-2]